MKLCEFTADGKCYRCETCGRYAPPGAVWPIRRQCRPDAKPEPYEHNCTGELGDYLEAIFLSVGITQERYQQAKQLFGLPPTCNCQGRKAWLNKVSRWWRGQKHN